MAIVSHPVILQGKSSPQAILRNQQATNERINERTNERRLNNSRTTFVRSPYRDLSSGLARPSLTAKHTTHWPKPIIPGTTGRAPYHQRRNTGVKFYVRLSRSRTVVSERGSRTAGPVVTEILPRGSILSRNIRLVGEATETPTCAHRRNRAKTNEPRRLKQTRTLFRCGRRPVGLLETCQRSATRSTCTLDKRRATVQPATATARGRTRETKDGKDGERVGSRASTSCRCFLLPRVFYR